MKNQSMNNNMKELFMNELSDMLSAEEQILQAMPTMIKAADTPELKEALETHFQETKEQVKRLKKIFSMLKMKATDKEKCEAMQGLIEECSEVINAFEASALRDAALISKAQRIEHYEISAYGTLRTFAKELGLKEAASLLQESLNEEANADKTLTKIAEGSLLTSGVNTKANKGE